MNISPSTLLVIGTVTAVINVLIVLALTARSRAHRARHVFELDGILSSSYIDSGPGDPARVPADLAPLPADPAPLPADPAPLPADEPPATKGWHGSTVRLADIDAGWPAIAFGASMPPSAEQAAAPEVEPFAYPAPTSLEQRSMDQDDTAPQAEDDDESEDRGEVVDELEDGAEETAEAETLAEDHADAVVDEEVDVTPVLTALPTLAAPSAPRGRDALTGMLDALSFEEALSHEDAREKRYRRSATVIVFELDGLARLVDRLGSDPGDRIEAALGDTITRLARRADYVARLERGRYAALLPETDEIAAINYVERIRRACDLWLESGAIAMRLAIGWASTGGDATLDGALRTATDRMRMESRRNSRLAGDAIEMPADEEASGL